MYRVVILEEAENDIDEAFLWYELQQETLGDAFYGDIEKAIEFIAVNPYSSGEKHKNIRRFIVKRFPYGIYYRIASAHKEIQILAVIHFKRSSRILKHRIIKVKHR